MFLSLGEMFLITLGLMQNCSNENQQNQHHPFHTILVLHNIIVPMYFIIYRLEHLQRIVSFRAQDFQRFIIDDNDYQVMVIQEFQVSN